jgi:hypothetical protein
MAGCLNAVMDIWLSLVPKSRVKNALWLMHSVGVSTNYDAPPDKIIVTK